MAQVTALTWPASFDLHRHWSCANLLAALMKVHRLCKGGEQRSDGGRKSSTLTENEFLSRLDPGASLSSILMQIPETFVSLNDPIAGHLLLRVSNAGALGQGNLFTSLPHYSWAMRPSFWHAGTLGLLNGFITMAESMIHFSTVRSLHPPTNLSTVG